VTVQIVQEDRSRDATSRRLETECAITADAVARLAATVPDDFEDEMPNHARFRHAPKTRCWRNFRSGVLARAWGLIEGIRTKSYFLICGSWTSIGARSLA
jgi:hypothetical protein